MQPQPTPLRVQRCQITCTCGELIPEAWGPETQRSGVRRAACWHCGKVWRFRPDPERGIPYEVVFNPANDTDGIARWTD